MEEKNFHISPCFVQLTTITTCDEIAISKDDSPFFINGRRSENSNAKVQLPPEFGMKFKTGELVQWLLNGSLSESDTANINGGLQSYDNDMSDVKCMRSDYMTSTNNAEFVNQSASDFESIDEDICLESDRITVSKSIESVNLKALHINRKDNNKSDVECIESDNHTDSVSLSVSDIDNKDGDESDVEGMKTDNSSDSDYIPVVKQHLVKNKKRKINMNNNNNIVTSSKWFMMDKKTVINLTESSYNRSVKDCNMNYHVSFSECDSYFDIVKWKYHNCYMKCLVCKNVFEDYVKYSNHIHDTMPCVEFYTLKSNGVTHYHCPPCRYKIKDFKNLLIHLTEENQHGEMGSVIVPRTKFNKQGTEFYVSGTIHNQRRTVDEDHHVVLEQELNKTGRETLQINGRHEDQHGEMNDVGIPRTEPNERSSCTEPNEKSSECIAQCSEIIDANILRTESNERSSGHTDQCGKINDPNMLRTEPVVISSGHTDECGKINYAHMLRTKPVVRSSPHTNQCGKLNDAIMLRTELVERSSGDENQHGERNFNIFEKSNKNSRMSVLSKIVSLTDKGWYCTLCNEIVHSWDKYQAIIHINQKHAEEIKCVVCSSHFPSMNAYHKHLETHVQCRRNEVDSNLHENETENFPNANLETESVKENSCNSSKEINTVNEEVNKTDINKSKANKHFDDYMEWKYSMKCLVCKKIFNERCKYSLHFTYGDCRKFFTEGFDKFYYCPPCKFKVLTYRALLSHLIREEKHGDMGCVNVSNSQSETSRVDEQLFTVDSEKSQGSRTSKVNEQLHSNVNKMQHETDASKISDGKEQKQDSIPLSGGWYCKICSKTIPCWDKKYAIKHISKFHKSEVKCPKCDEIVASRSALENHLSNCQKPYSVPCPTCGKLYSKKYMRIHILKYHSKDINKETDSQMPPFSCNLCHLTFLHKSSLNRHREEHSETKTLMCEICGAMFNSNTRLGGHMKFHRKRPKILKQCEICHKWLAKKSYLTHKQGHMEPQTCSICGKLTKNVNIHMLSHGERRFRCQICNKAFKLGHHLKNHMVVHTEQRKFKCHICSYEFNLKHHLESHLKTKHDIIVRKKSE